MAQSVHQLRAEAERQRAQLAETIDLLKQRVSETTEDIRYKVSPAGIKEEISNTSKNWWESMKHQAAENPLAALAAATAVGIPALKLTRSVSPGLLLMGAGLALTSGTVRARANEAVAPALEKASTLAEQAGQYAQTVRGSVAEKVSSAAAIASEKANRARDAASELASRMKDTAGQVQSQASSAMDSAADLARQTAGQARQTADSVRSRAEQAARSAPASAQNAIAENAVAISALGLAIGAIIAATLPSTRLESATIGAPSDAIKGAAKDAARSAVATATRAASAAAEAATERLANSGLDEHASRTTENLAETVKTVSEDLVTTAFDPAHNERNNQPS